MLLASWEMQDREELHRHVKPTVELCNRCRFAATCTYATGWGEQVFACPGFMPDETCVAEAAKSRELGAIGLCASCGRAETCTRDCPLSGVWHCEDYC